MPSANLRLSIPRTRRTFYRPLHLRLTPVLRHGSRSISQSTARYSQDPSSDPGKDERLTEQQELGAMSRRLEEMTEKTVEHGGRSAQKAVEEAGFSEELKQRLEARIADSMFKAENPAAFAQVNLPVRFFPGSLDSCVRS